MGYFICATSTSAGNPSSFKLYKRKLYIITQDPASARMCREAALSSFKLESVRLNRIRYALSHDIIPSIFFFFLDFASFLSRSLGLPLIPRSHGKSNEFDSRFSWSWEATSVNSNSFKQQAQSFQHRSIEPSRAFHDSQSVLDLSETAIVSRRNELFILSFFFKKNFSAVLMLILTDLRMKKSLPTRNPNRGSKPAPRCPDSSDISYFCLFTISWNIWNSNICRYFEDWLPNIYCRNGQPSYESTERRLDSCSTSRCSSCSHGP